ncbi:hypothetical protein N7452_006099 [Penicillium brevicompactum]|uniref:Rpr2-domain-containing protein n=1 Tax=Penicillium brevicompactum TaxID=5074 RepID=A0A9W9QK25_PENBR|nr:hypothetical protein N7452_006099 [Penicillium brevicompactum]
MPKAKADKKGGKKENKNTQSHIRARLDYLHQAAVYLQNQSKQQDGENLSQAPHGAQLRQQRQSQSTSGTVHNKSKAEQSTPTSPETEGPLGNISRTCVLHLRDVAMKTQIRLPVTLKRTLCKRCATLLKPGVTSSHEIRNESRGGKKPWADVLIVRCLPCGAEKRFPQTEKRAKKLSERGKEKKTALSQNDIDMDLSPAVSKGEGNVHDQRDSNIVPETAL